MRCKRVTLTKVKAFTHKKIINLCKSIGMPYLPYRSYWHYRLHRTTQSPNSSDKYLGAIPNRGAGIGHQLANWIAGLWFSKKFDCKFVHIPFSNQNWENLLGFGLNESTLKDLRKKGIIRRLPLFDESKEDEVRLIQNIIDSYENKTVIFIAEQDQFYRAQYEVMDDLKHKFYSAPARSTDKLIYDESYYNIAIHIRRGDILADPSNPNLSMRFLANDYYINVLTQTLQRIHQSKPIRIYIFSQGVQTDFPEFSTFDNIIWCLDMDQYNSFVHLVYADCLITSKSSFSYKPALINKGLKVCPLNFWHDYPHTEDWIMADDYGNLK